MSKALIMPLPLCTLHLGSAMNNAMVGFIAISFEISFQRMCHKMHPTMMPTTQNDLQHSLWLLLLHKRSMMWPKNLPQQVDHCLLPVDNKCKGCLWQTPIKKFQYIPTFYFFLNIFNVDTIAQNKRLRGAF